MKRFILVMALVVLMTGAVSAEGILFGMKGGLNLANIYGDDSDDSKIQMAFGGGVWMNYAFTEAFSLQPELMYMMKGADLEGEGGMEGSIKFTYLDINLLAKYAIPTEGNFVPCLFAGPYLGMLVAADLEIEIADIDDDIKDYTKSMDFGMVFGAGFDYMLEAGGCITFDFRYALGLSDLADDSDESLAYYEDLEGEPLTEVPSFKNSGIQFMVGYGFNF